ncbi:Yox1 protein [Saccharomycopsis crataegensis]|uniref:Yox1 protein n=1 Tax=Saccharomycopsis crataegensis TaxID=43959 RepID=A0AAV5QTA5_9ASCO|nr:Yox1 protein [Saccharomycopsis crataegensis]
MSLSYSTFTTSSSQYPSIMNSNSHNSSRDRDLHHQLPAKNSSSRPISLPPISTLIGSTGTGISESFGTPKSSSSQYPSSYHVTPYSSSQYHHHHHHHHFNIPPSTSPLMITNRLSSTVPFRASVQSPFEPMEPYKNYEGQLNLQTPPTIKKASVSLTGPPPGNVSPSHIMENPIPNSLHSYHYPYQPPQQPQGPSLPPPPLPQLAPPTPPSTASSAAPKKPPAKKPSNEKIFAFISHSPATFPSQEPSIDNAQLARRKRRRTSTHELSILQLEFGLGPNPGKARRQQIADKVKMDEKAVQIWFQNKRQSIKRSKNKAAGVASIPEETEADGTNSSLTPGANSPTSSTYSVSRKSSLGEMSSNRTSISHSRTSSYSITTSPMTPNKATTGHGTFSAPATASKAQYGKTGSPSGIKKP